MMTRPSPQSLRRTAATAALLAALAVVADAHLAAAASPTPTIPERAFVDRFLPVPDVVMTTVGELLPEESNAGASFLSGKYDPNIYLKETATVAVTFVWEGAGYRNTLGYFTYDVTPEGFVKIIDRQLIFPNASLPTAGKLATGDTSTLRDAAGQIRVFPAGTRIGFFVVADGFSSNDFSRDWVAATATVPTDSPKTNRSTVKGVFTTLDAINPENADNAPELARHVAMVNIAGLPGFLDGNDFLLMGFEDQNRVKGSDNDFNDCVFLVTATPQTAIATDNLETVEPPSSDPDGDGVPSANDAYPRDPTRALINQYPSRDFDMIGLEDQYPGIGDADYNDAVVAAAYQVVTDAKGNVRDLLGTFHLLARGASYDHAFGIHLPALPDGAVGTVYVQRFLEDDAQTVEVDKFSLDELIGKGQRRLVVFPSTRAALPSVGKLPYVNTQRAEPDRLAASARFWISFDEAIPAKALGDVPFDPYFLVTRKDGRYDVHLPGTAAFADRPADLPDETGADSFLDDNGYPWVIVVPFGWRFPLEAIRIENAYRQFPTWAASYGEKYPEWYLEPIVSEVASPRSDYAQKRDWTIDLPIP